MPSTRRHVLALAGGTAAGTLFPTGGARTQREERAADWPMARYDPAGTGAHPTVAGPKNGVSIAWQFGQSGHTGRPITPIRLDGTLYAVHDGVVALNCATGSKQFHRDGDYQSSLARAQSSIYTTETLAVTGQSGPVGLNAGGGFSLPGMDMAIGVQRWTGPRAAGGGFFGPPQATAPVPVDGTVYAAPAGTGTVAALDANDGSVRWQVAPGSDGPGSREFNRPAVADGAVFVTSWPYLVTALDAETGEQRWQRELAEQMVLAPVATDAGLVVQTRNGVTLLDVADGTTRWEQSLEANATDGMPAVAAGRIFVADSQESLHALDLSTGELLWTTEFTGEAAPVVADGIVYAVASGHRLVAVDAESGDRRFTYEPPIPPFSAPIVGDGTLYLATGDSILALEEYV